MNDIYEAILETRKVGGKAALATIVSQKGSTPAPLGSKYLVREDGSTVGTIGGGCVEAEVIELAQEVLCTGRTETKSFTLNRKDLPESGLIC
ncbi:MAG: XdhC family protein, partial [bacterium]|nr:XdhC family protein [bacterium]